VIDIGIGSGVESMTHGGAPGDPSNLPPMNMSAIFEHPLAKDTLMSMGMTSETVAKRYGVSREEQDAFAVESHTKALKAMEQGKFTKEIVPVTVTVEDAEGKEQTVTVSKDEGPRAGTNLAGLSKLKPAFDKEKGTTTAGNASQTSDGAAAVLMMRRSEALKRNLPILGVFRGFKVKGCLPDEMGIGPAVAIPAVLKDVNLGINDVDVYEINEAFASQAVYCVKKLGIKQDKVNPNGGAIALGHPLGATGARQVATLLNELQRRKAASKSGKPLTGVVSMCIGTGMGAAGVFEV
jgi:acetyl-CoA acyltransferase 1